MSPFGFIDALILFLFILCILLWKRSRRPAAYPPGPTPFPIIGNMCDIAGPHVLKTFRKLRKKYGDIFSLSIGKFWVIVVNGPDNLREVFIKNGEYTSNRPPMYTIKLLGNKGIGSTYGPTWKHQRTFTISKLRDFGFGKRSFENRIMEEVQAFVHLMRSFSGKPFDWGDILNTSMVNNLLSITIGRRFDYHDPEFSRIVSTITEVTSNPAINGPVNVMPTLADIPGDPFRVMPVTKQYQSFIDYFRREVEAHLYNYDENNISDFIDSYLHQMKTCENPEVYSVDNLANILSDLTLAGGETTATTLKWTVLYPLHQPDIQDKMKKELDDVIGNGRLPSLSDRPNLPYCNAVINESLRLGNVAPLALPHLVSGDFICKGFKFPKDSVVFPCLDSVVNDETLFPDSQLFNPERFLDENGKLCNQEKLMNFSLDSMMIVRSRKGQYLESLHYEPKQLLSIPGRRVCLGESFARMVLFLYLTTFIQMFEFHPIKGEDLPTTDSILGLTNSPIPYKFITMPRE